MLLRNSKKFAQKNHSFPELSITSSAMNPLDPRRCRENIELAIPQAAAYGMYRSMIL